jgi:hypothetical protein
VCQKKAPPRAHVSDLADEEKAILRANSKAYYVRKKAELEALECV